LPGRLEGKVALITTVVRRQGRSHAVRLAEKGMDITGFDIYAQLYRRAVPAVDAGLGVR